MLSDTSTADPSGNSEASVRWLFCYGEGGSGQGIVALTSKNSTDWMLARLGFGTVSHAGDSPEASVLDTTHASVTYDAMAGERHDHAFTSDGGEHWISVFVAPNG